MKNSLTNESIDKIIKKIIFSMLFFAIITLIVIIGRIVAPDEYTLLFNISLIILCVIHMFLALSIIFFAFMKKNV